MDADWSEWGQECQDDEASWCTTSSDECHTKGPSDPVLPGPSLPQPAAPPAAEGTPSSRLTVRRRRDLELYGGVATPTGPLPRARASFRVVFDRQLHSDAAPIHVAGHSDVEELCEQSSYSTTHPRLGRSVLDEDTWSWDEEEESVEISNRRPAEDELNTNNSNACTEAVEMMLDRLYGDEDRRSPARCQPGGRDRCWERYSDRYSNHGGRDCQQGPYSEMVTEWQKRAFEFVSDTSLLNDGDQVIRLDGRDGGGTLLYDLASCRYVRSHSVSPTAAAVVDCHTKTKSASSNAGHARPAGALRRRRQAARHLGYLAAASARCRSVDSAMTSDPAAVGRRGSNGRRRSQSHGRGHAGREDPASPGKGFLQDRDARRPTVSPQGSTATDSTDSSWSDRNAEEEDWLLSQVMDALAGEMRQVRVNPYLDDIELLELIDDELSGRPATDLHRRPDDYVNDYVSRLRRFLSNMDYFLQS